MFRQLLAWLTLIVTASAFAFGHGADGNDADTIIALERGALDRWGHGDPGGYLELYDRDVTYFDPSHERRIDGAEGMRRALEPIKGRIKIDRYEAIAPRVDRNGNVAILTYNLVNHGRRRDGKMELTRWNSTAVYVRSDGHWKILHSHWSLTKPELKVPIAQ